MLLLKKIFYLIMIFLFYGTLQSKASIQEEYTISAIKTKLEEETILNKKPQQSTIVFEKSTAKKVIKDGNLYFERDGKLYNVLGVMVENKKDSL